MSEGTPLDRKPERDRQERVSGWLDAPLAALALVLLALLVLQLFAELPPGWAHWVGAVETAIWAIFAIAFAVELALARSKTGYLKKNWLAAISVLLPVFGVLRIARVAVALRAVRLVRIVTVLNRSVRALGHILRRGRFGYVTALALAVTATAAAGAYYFERGQPEASVNTVGDAIWWASTTVTTINSPLEVVTFEGRFIGLVLRMFALAFSGYVTANIAVYLLGGFGRSDETEPSEPDLRSLQQKIDRLEKLLEERLPPAEKK